jgi:hypothetical protein
LGCHKIEILADPPLKTRGKNDFKEAVSHSTSEKYQKRSGRAIERLGLTSRPMVIWK